MKKYPFDPSLKHHFIIALALAIWIFVFLYFTEPLDVAQLSSHDKLRYLPFYGLIGALCYVFVLPLQYKLLKKSNGVWSIKSELIFCSILIVLTFLMTRAFYLYVVVGGQPNPYTLDYYLLSIYLPAILTILPIIFIGRFAFGKYKNKKIEEQKIEIKGDGNYEGLRLLFSNLIALEASDNYVEVHYQDHGVLKKQLIRARLSDVEQSHPDLVRTHRSYLINPSHFISYTSEKGKLGLVLSRDTLIPVSKTYATRVKAHLNFATN